MFHDNGCGSPRGEERLQPVVDRTPHLSRVRIITAPETSSLPGDHHHANRRVNCSHLLPWERSSHVPSGLPGRFFLAGDVQTQERTHVVEAERSQ